MYKGIKIKSVKNYENRTWFDVIAAIILPHIVGPILCRFAGCRFSVAVTLDFPYQTLWQYSDEDSLNEGVECRWVGKNRDSLRISAYRIDGW